MELPIDERNVFNCTSLDSFDALISKFVSAPNYKEVNFNVNRSFSSGLSAYRRYLQYLEDSISTQTQVDIEKETVVAKCEENTKSKAPSIVDFSHPELCTGCNPISCVIEGKDLGGGNWRDILVSVTEEFLQTKSKIKNLYRRSLSSNGESEFLLKDKPKLTARKLSNGYWVNVNLSIKDLVITIGKLCQYCGVDLNNVEITYVPKSGAESELSNSVPKSTSVNNSRNAQYYEETQKSLESNVPSEVIRVLNRTYSSGFRFESTYLNLLLSSSGVAITENIQSEMKRIMFHRNDDIYFLLDNVADALMHLLRSTSETMRYRGMVEELIEVKSATGETSGREKEAIFRLCTAYLKLFFPHANSELLCTAKFKQEFDKYCLTPAKNMQETVLKQMRFVNPGMFPNGNLGFSTYTVRWDL